MGEDISFFRRKAKEIQPTGKELVSHEPEQVSVVLVANEVIKLRNYKFRRALVIKNAVLILFRTAFSSYFLINSGSLYAGLG